MKYRVKEATQMGYLVSQAIALQPLLDAEAIITIQTNTGNDLGEVRYTKKL